MFDSNGNYSSTYEWMYVDIFRREAFGDYSVEKVCPASGKTLKELYAWTLGVIDGASDSGTIHALNVDRILKVIQTHYNHFKTNSEMELRKQIIQMLLKVKEDV